MKILSILERLKEPPLNKQYKVFRALDYFWYILLSYLENIYIRLIPISRLGLNDTERKCKIIASLTTYPGRIDVVYYAIKSILHQTMPPDRVILWLSEIQFPDHRLPDSLVTLKSKGLEIKFTKDDYRSHKKYFYVLQEQKNDELVITFDDDIIYDPQCIERAYIKHQQYPKAIVVNQALQVRFDDEGHIMPFNRWVHPFCGGTPSFSFIPLTGSGCLYPYNVISPMAFDWDKIQRYALTTDDLWIKFMSTLSDTPIVVTEPRSKIFTTVSFSQNSHLGQINCIEGQNDKDFASMVEAFPRVMEKLIKEKSGYE